jgi:GGDEF domain-containing protein
LNLCHIYNQSTNSPHIKKILESFDNSASFNINDIDKTRDYNIYLIETNDVDKELSLRLKKFFDSKPNMLIYFLVPKNYTLMLFQLAFLLGAKTVITPNQDTDKILAKIKNDFKSYETKYLEHLLGKAFIKTQAIILFKHNKPFFASKEFLQEFKCKNLPMVEEKILSQIDMNTILLEDENIIKPIKNNLNEEKKYVLRSMNINDKDEKIVFVEPYVQEKNLFEELSFLSTRISFIELLKDKLIEKSISKKSFSIITIQIENMKKLEKDLNKVETEGLIKDLLIHIEGFLDKKLILAQYSGDFYVTLFENIGPNIKKKAQDFYTQILNYIHKQKHHPAVGLFAFNVGESDLNDILVMLENIATKTLSKEQISKNNIHYINNIQEHMNENEMINFLLEDAFINAREFKLLNIYKGLCVNTSSKIIKKTEDTISVEFEQLQGIVMRDETETVMQSSSFVKDIRARVKYIDLQKKVAILDNFEFLGTSANARKYSRVTCHRRTPLVLSYHGGTINGEILDISVNSIAIKVKLIKNMDILKAKKVKLAFTLPTQTNIDGFIKLNLEADVTFIANVDNTSSKIVCDLDEDTSNEAILMEYVYNRQKEIIVEVRKMAKAV